MILLEVMSSLRKSIKESVEACQRFCSVEFEIPEINLEFPELKIHGELSTNAALVFSKKFFLSPIALADIMLKNFNKPEYIEDVRVELPGFINFFLSKNFFKKVLLDIDENLENYTEKNKKNKKILVEFVSANPTGPMHIGNARLGALGDSLSEVLKFAGFDVYREFYVNDAGNQIKKFAESLAARYVQIFDPTAKFPEDGYHGSDIKELADKFGVARERVASILDIFASVGQGISPHGGQLLTAGRLAGISPAAMIPFCWYPILMGVSSLVFIGLGIANPAKKKA